MGPEGPAKAARQSLGCGDEMERELEWRKDLPWEEVGFLDEAG